MNDMPGLKFDAYLTFITINFFEITQRLGDCVSPNYSYPHSGRIEAGGILVNTGYVKLLGCPTIL
jgi:hypothetical protein